MKVVRTVIVLFILIAAMLQNGSLAARAQSASNPILWITWRAATYIPSEYSGRALPTPGSNVVVALDIIQDGVPADLSGETIYWYVNDNYLTGGTGVTRTSITMPDVIGQGAITVRVSLPQSFGGVAKTITIPVVSPKAVIETIPSDIGATNSNSAFDMLAKPYFFTVNDPSELTTTWSVNGQSPSTYNDPSHLRVAVPSGTPAGTALTVQLKIDNTAHSFETAFNNLVLTVQ